MTATIRKRIIIALSVMIMLLAGFGILSACGSQNTEIKVTFMVQNDSGTWGEYSTAVVTDGTVEMPAEPTKTYYTFANWYYTEDFSGDVFTNKDISESRTVYAKFNADEVSVVINGTSQGTQNLVDVVNGTYDPGEGLEFDGWYTNADCNTEAKWNGTAVVQTLYAKSVARITFNNGYEDVYTTTVTPNTVYASPATATSADDSTKTIEEVSIRKNYMSKYDISYVDEDGEEFDFTQPITKNTKITVKWRSPFFTYEENEATGNLILTMYSDAKYDDTETSLKISDAPVLSVLSTITFDNNNDGVAESYTVEGIRLETDILAGSSIKKMIIGEGIISIQALLSSSGSSIEEIVLPSTLKVIQNCFNNLNSLKSITIPDGVEVIIGSFWANTIASHNSYYQYNKGETYDFDIAIPESVKNLSMVPSNLTFTHTKDNAQNGDFYKDGNYIYQLDDRAGHEGDLVLIGDYTTGDSITVPEGVKGIQVGTYFNRTLKYLVIPSTFSYVRYNENLDNYPSCKSQYSTKSALWDSQYASDPKGHIPPMAYCVFAGLDSITYMSVQQASYPEGLSVYAFIGDPTGWAALSETMYEASDSQSFAAKILYLAESDAPQVNVAFENTLTGESYTATLTKSKNETVTVAELLSAIDTEKGTTLANAYAEGKLKVTSLTSFGNAYDVATQIKSNLYLDIEVTYSVDGGYTATANADGKTATIAAYNSATAYQTAEGKIVGIPSEVTIGGTKYTVTAIGANAFANASDVLAVVLPSTVKTIGEKAFYNAASIEAIDMSACKLETIGASAFEGTSITEITLALSELKSVGAYAFKIDTLEEFVVADGEENRDMLTKTDLKEGDFFFEYTTVYITYTNSRKAAVGLYSYSNKTTDSESGVTTWNVKFIASAAASGVSEINIGNVDDSENIICYEVMEGSYYYLDSMKIYLNCVSKLHANAFTDCETLSRLYYSKSYVYAESVRKANLLIEACPDLFEDGWYSGVSDFSNIRSSVF